MALARFRKHITRRRFFGACACATLGGIAGFAYMRQEAEALQVVERRLPSVPSNSLRILHLSDMHASPAVSLEHIERAVDLGIAQRPDLICLTGDFITTKYDRFADFADVLGKLSKAAPTFASLGNHDGGSWVKYWGYPDWKNVAQMLSTAGIKLLHNSLEKIEIKGRALQILGLGDLWAHELKPMVPFSRAEAGLQTIVLSHNPDSKMDLANFRWDLMLSGHTHGGQLWLPIFGAPFAPVRDKRYVAGLNAWRDRWIHTTKGVGNLHGLRFNCRPEVSVVNV